MKELANHNGQIFESKTNFYTILNGDNTFQYIEKYKFKKWLLNNYDIDIKSIWSKNLLPDEALYNKDLNTIFIIEKKYQSCPGSVDEKLQTCAFKKWQYNKIEKITGIKIEYIYCFNDWFEDSKYDDVKDFIILNGCFWFYDYNFPFHKLYSGFN